MRNMAEDDLNNMLTSAYTDDFWICAFKWLIVIAGAGYVWSTSTFIQFK